MSDVHIIGIAGSLSRKSANRALIEAAKEQAPDGMTIEHFLLDFIPLYNHDLDGDMPEPVKELKRKIEDADGTLIATPEYNYSYSGVIKNAIDWASRPYGKNSLARKPVALMSAAMSIGGGMRAQHHLRQVLGSADMRQLYTPEVFVAASHMKIENGELKDEETKKFIAQLLVAFKELIERDRALSGPK
jgi:chromate reductase